MKKDCDGKPEKQEEKKKLAKLDKPKQIFIILSQCIEEKNNLLILSVILPGKHDRLENYKCKLSWSIIHILLSAIVSDGDLGKSFRDCEMVTQFGGSRSPLVNKFCIILICGELQKKTDGVVKATCFK